MMEKLKIKLSDFKFWDVFCEIFYRRNIVMHNKSMTNEIYCKKTGFKQKGVLLETDFKYLEVSINLFKAYVVYLADRVGNKYDFVIEIEE